jgi:hypothetical protein
MSRDDHTNAHRRLALLLLQELATLAGCKASGNPPHRGRRFVEWKSGFSTQFPPDHVHHLKLTEVN